MPDTGAPWNLTYPDDTGSTDTWLHWQQLAEDTAAALDTLFAAYEDHSPVWTTNGAAPSVGDGSLTGRTQPVGGGNVKFGFELVIGATTNTGTGEWRFDVLIPAANPEFEVGAAWLYDDDTATNRQAGVVRFLDANTLLVYGPGGEVDEINPWIWATGDILRASITYEPAP